LFFIENIFFFKFFFFFFFWKSFFFFWYIYIYLKYKEILKFNTYVLQYILNWNLQFFALGPLNSVYGHALNLRYVWYRSILTYYVQYVNYFKNFKINDLSFFYRSSFRSRYTFEFFFFFKARGVDLYFWPCLGVSLLPFLFLKFEKLNFLLLNFDFFFFEFKNLFKSRRLFYTYYFKNMKLFFFNQWFLNNCAFLKDIIFFWNFSFFYARSLKNFKTFKIINFFELYYFYYCGDLLYFVLKNVKLILYYRLLQVSLISWKKLGVFYLLFYKQRSQIKYKFFFFFFFGLIIIQPFFMLYFKTSICKLYSVFNVIIYGVKNIKRLKCTLFFFYFFCKLRWISFFYNYFWYLQVRRIYLKGLKFILRKSLFFVFKYVNSKAVNKKLI
jgi:hypothetical protein